MGILYASVCCMYWEPGSKLLVLWYDINFIAKGFFDQGLRIRRTSVSDIQIDVSNIKIMFITYRYKLSGRFYEKIRSTKQNKKS